MILKLVSTIVMGIAALFGLEALGVIPANKYFPTLPRLDREANTPGNWMEAGNWGLNAASCLTQGKSLATCTDGAEATPEDRKVARQAPAKETIVWDDVDRAVDTAIEQGDSAADNTPLPAGSFTTRVAQRG
jgi:hypothetical protein